MSDQHVPIPHGTSSSSSPFVLLILAVTFVTMVLVSILVYRSGTKKEGYAADMTEDSEDESAPTTTKKKKKVEEYKKEKKASTDSTDSGEDESPAVDPSSESFVPLGSMTVSEGYYTTVEGYKKKKAAAKKSSDSSSDSSDSTATTPAPEDGAATPSSDDASTTEEGYIAQHPRRLFNIFG